MLNANPALITGGISVLGTLFLAGLIFVNNLLWRMGLPIPKDQWAYVIQFAPLATVLIAVIYLIFALINYRRSASEIAGSIVSFVFANAFSVVILQLLTPAYYYFIAGGLNGLVVIGCLAVLLVVCCFRAPSIITNYRPIVNFLYIMSALALVIGANVWLCNTLAIDTLLILVAANALWLIISLISIVSFYLLSIMLVFAIAG